MTMEWRIWILIHHTQSYTGNHTKNKIAPKQRIIYLPWLCIASRWKSETIVNETYKKQKDPHA